ncbi:DUF3558 domain-containing protein [Nocardia puris]|uniref:DUF3558 domain-containing protein n=1 Tax=Nocardia puris TaxID=208602 RepID=UPI001893B00C|nr:DUF3558 domain-containing protein [Nocardia puris]MBF6211087.1 DUF3558 domain-containing protein [Nocardia puris]
MRIAHALRTAITGGAVLVLAAGCGTEVGGQATSTSTTTTPSVDNLLNPCTDISDEWLIETGVDPATEQDIVNPTDASAWRICGWRSVDLPYRLDLLSTSRTIDEARANPDLEILREITIGSRQGLVLQNKSDSDGDICYVSLPAAQGMFEIAVAWRSSQPKTHDRCELAIEHATDLEPHLPK